LSGIHIAERSLFLGISRLLGAFDVSKALDSEGVVITPDTDDLVRGITVQARTYPARFVPGSAAKVDLIQAAEAEYMTLIDPVTGQWKWVPHGMAFSTWTPDGKDT
jgi:hypothetical protein